MLSHLNTQIKFLIFSCSLQLPFKAKSSLHCDKQPNTKNQNNNSSLLFNRDHICSEVCCCTAVPIFCNIPKTSGYTEGLPFAVESNHLLPRVSRVEGRLIFINTTKPIPVIVERVFLRICGYLLGFGLQRQWVAQMYILPYIFDLFFFFSAAGNEREL